MTNIKMIILDLVMAEVVAQLEATERGRLFAIAESKAHKGAMASRYDTFKEEAQYLAGGMNAQSIGLRETLGLLYSLKEKPPIVKKGSGYAIVEAENLDDGTTTKYFLLPAGGGNSYEVAGEKILVINAGAPLARAFIGAVEGDEVQVNIQGKKKIFNIISVV